MKKIILSKKRVGRPKVSPSLKTPKLENDGQLKKKVLKGRPRRSVDSSDDEYHPNRSTVVNDGQKRKRGRPKRSLDDEYYSNRSTVANDGQMRKKVSSKCSIDQFDEDFSPKKSTTFEPIKIERFIPESVSSSSQMYENNSSFINSNEKISTAINKSQSFPFIRPDPLGMFRESKETISSSQNQSTYFDDEPINSRSIKRFSIGGQTVKISLNYESVISRRIANEEKTKNDLQSSDDSDRVNEYEFEDGVKISELSTELAKISDDSLEDYVVLN